MTNQTTNIVIAGLGGQGIITASDILAEAALLAGFDVKKSELHGMSQRGGSVTSDVRYGSRVLSPMVPVGEADVLLVMESTQIEVARPQMRPDGILLTPECIPMDALKNKKSFNIAMLGVLSTVLELPEAHWYEAMHIHLAEKLHRLNDEAFALGRQVPRH